MASVSEASVAAEQALAHFRELGDIEGVREALHILGALEEVATSDRDAAPLRADFRCDCSDQLQGVPGPPGPKCRKSLKRGRPGPVGPECQKSAEKVEKVPKRDFFRDVLDFSALLWHSGPTGLGRPF